MLEERGFTDWMVVPEQRDPDPDFSTLSYPNPEDPAAFELSEKYGRERGAELLLATDPDADRFAIEILDANGSYVPLNGNQTGYLLVHYILDGLAKAGRLPAKGAMVKSIVTSTLSTIIASSYGVEMFETLTDFAWRDMSVCLSSANAYDGLHGTAFAADVNALMDNVRSDAELADGYHDYEVETAEEEAWLTEEPDDLPWDEPEFEFGAESESEAVDDASGESRRRVPDYIVGTEADYEAREALAEERRKRAREAEEAAIGGMSPREARNARAMGFGL
jgi:hypothetical protein